jgi:hypothetical protein
MLLDDGGQDGLPARAGNIVGQSLESWAAIGHRLRELWRGEGTRGAQRARQGLIRINNTATRGLSRFRFVVSGINPRAGVRAVPSRVYQLVEHACKRSFTIQANVFIILAQFV